MNIEIPLLIVADLIAAVVLTFGLYWRRHYRRDLVVAFMGINVGVLSVSAVLADSEVGAGVGLGLFGVLSIIRLRSDELAQHEIAYYFAMLALGLLGGLDAAPLPLSLVFMVLVVVTMAVIDHPGLLGGNRRQEIILDRAIADPAELRAHLAELLDAEIRAVSVSRLDLVNDTTVVDVRFRRPEKGAARVAEGAAQ
ncbi:DUF4956 domain-containing protein [Brachybacterium alimentarium]|uniref:DUF4956 domain-containing protein n=1 Tax=Brachybacterium alimentarium TaxID=47845 RepID=A0A2A3YKF7_9MICO|nr:DUF4956 domain-containing protein [Brachybacterium alimentarium]PCC35341.1 DUF4956 domain-containing protein [Brachybacterium alimentarium]PCC39761.1 DUF4956 domain-containing protein [Brachybacterium alimentarium]RCS77423.1 DUF4956 domain-containing protein [Brachybacterium alimentarium]RCS78987.1 DUF4956 domain-containing protein [Brachybacterium alimentarium]RCS85255.1 DUF4956 domain-containing protein [Brachybacterium alimentarium]